VKNFILIISTSCTSVSRSNEVSINGIHPGLGCKTYPRCKPNSLTYLWAEDGRDVVRQAFRIDLSGSEPLRCSAVLISRVSTLNYQLCHVSTPGSCRCRSRKHLLFMETRRIAYGGMSHCPLTPYRDPCLEACFRVAFAHTLASTAARLDGSNDAINIRSTTPFLMRQDIHTKSLLSTLD